MAEPARTVPSHNWAALMRIATTAQYVLAASPATEPVQRWLLD